MKKSYHLPVALLLSLPISMASLAGQPQTETKPMPAVNMTEDQKDQHARAIQEHMLQMHDLSNRILAEQDPAKKEQLKVQQLELMKEHHANKRAAHHMKK
ncbi:MAG: hypothetical protein Q7U57_11130 [Methylovulum sp.]|nr:hypothetical protein [Methylovulum sp.]